MKMPSLLALIAVLGTVSVLWCENVTVTPELISAVQRSQVTVLRDMKPVPNARLELLRKINCSSADEIKFPSELVTNKKGQVSLPKLTVGVYRIVVSAGPTWSGETIVSLAPPETNPKRAAYFSSIAGCGVSEGTAEKRAFSIGLNYIPTPEEIQTQREQNLLKNDQLPATKISVFHGVVQDSSGAPIPSAKIEVVDMGATGNKRTILLHSDPQGKFAADLPDGDYVATFDSQGFRQRVFHLAISKAENADELRIKLEVGSTT
jgi:hypothetical protein